MVNNGIITAPINMKDPYICMGVGAIASKGYDLEYICSNQHGKINMWSKFKPYKSYHLDTTDDDRKNDYFGLVIDESGYSYAPPLYERGDALRLCDFINYDHNAVRGIAFYPLTGSKNIFYDKSPFVVTLNKNENQITFYDVRNHPIFSQYNQFLFRIMNVTNGVEISRTVNIGSDDISLVLTYEDLVNLGTGIVRITCEFSNGVISNHNLIPDTCVLTLESDTGIMFNNNNTISNLMIGTDASDMDDISQYRTGSGSKSLDLNGKNLLISTFSVHNGATEKISQSNIYLIMRFKNASGKSVYVRCPVYHNISNKPYTWSINPNSNYYLTPYINDSSLPVVDENGNSRGVQLAFQYKLVRDGIEEFYDITSPYEINVKRSKGVIPIII